MSVTWRYYSIREDIVTSIKLGAKPGSMGISTGYSFTVTHVQPMKSCGRILLLTEIDLLLQYPTSLDAAHTVRPAQGSSPLLWYLGHPPMDHS